MMKLSGIYLTDQVAKDGSQFSLESLEDIVWKGHREGRPTHIAHDMNRFCGWTKTKGLYMSHEMSYVLGETYIPETEDEIKQLMQYRDIYLNNGLRHQIEPYLERFIRVLNDCGFTKLDECKFFYKNIVVAKGDELIYKIFPFIKEQLDNDGLISVRALLTELTYIDQGVFQKKGTDLAIMLHPYFRRSNSVYNNFNFGLIERLIEVYNDGNESVKVRLDADVVGFVPSFVRGAEYDYWYGPHYSDDISSIKEGVTRHVSTDADRLYSNIQFDEFVWEKKDNEYQFEMEEVIDAPHASASKECYLCRYIHSFYDFRQKSFRHFDGAVREYDLKLMCKRLDTNMDKMGHEAHYTKLFRMDGDVPLHTWKSIITQYMYEDPLVPEYFGNPIVQEQQSLPLGDAPSYKKLLPCLLKKGDGVRVFLSYHTKEVDTSVRSFVTCDAITTLNGVENVMEWQTIEVAKALRRVGASISLSHTQKYALVEDYVHNIPIIHHGEPNPLEAIGKTLTGIRVLMEQHAKNGDKDIYSFCLSWNIEDVCVRFAFAGHVYDLNIWLQSFEVLPVEREKLVLFMQQQREYIIRNGRDGDSPLQKDYTTNDGVIYFKRRCVNQDAEIKSVKMVGEGLACDIDVEKSKKWILSHIEKKDLYFTPVFILQDASCNDNRDSYIKSSRSKIFKECGYTLSQDTQLVGWVWSLERRPMCIV